LQLALLDYKDTEVVMSPTIRIDDEVFDELKKHAEPFVDTPNTVLRRLLGLGEGVERESRQADLDFPAVKLAVAAESKGGRVTRRRGRRTKAVRPPRARTGSILPEATYEVPVLEIISEHGGRAPAREVLDELGKRLRDRLTDVDHEKLVSGDVRWRNRAQFVRLRLVEQGDMVKDSPRGVWEISEQGRRRLAADAA
jgi:hypothetical protein